MKKEEALIKFDELGGDSREGNGPFRCKPIEIAAARNGFIYFLEGRDNPLVTKGSDCHRDCCFYSPPEMDEYKSFEDKESSWQVAPPTCLYRG